MPVEGKRETPLYGVESLRPLYKIKNQILHNCMSLLHYAELNNSAVQHCIDNNSLRLFL
jgi:hypothetical protein